MGHTEVSSFIGNDWDQAFRSFSSKINMESLEDSLAEKYDLYPNQINPPSNAIFRAFEETPLSKVEVVLIGQDPYPGHGVADGLAFSARLQKRAPASLINLNREWNQEFHLNFPIRNDLTYLAQQGVFLYNTCLISRDGQPLFFGGDELYSEFSRLVIKKISDEREFCVFLLLGRAAQTYEKEVDASKHAVLKAAHPSPLSANRGFFGSGIFTECNKLLSNHGHLPIDWLGQALD